MKMQGVRFLTPFGMTTMIQRLSFRPKGPNFVSFAFFVVKFPGEFPPQNVRLSVHVARIGGIPLHRSRDSLSFQVSGKATRHSAAMIQNACPASLP